MYSSIVYNEASIHETTVQCKFWTLSRMPPPGPCVILCLLISNHSDFLWKVLFLYLYQKCILSIFMLWSLDPLHIMTFLYLCSFIQYDIYVSSVILLSLLFVVFHWINMQKFGFYPFYYGLFASFQCWYNG